MTFTNASGVSEGTVKLALTAGLVALLAINRFIRIGLERNHRVLAACRAHSREHFAVRACTAATGIASGQFLSRAAFRAALRLIVIALLAEERLLILGENK